MGCRGPYVYGQGMLVYLNNEPDRWILFFYRLKHVQGQALLKIDAVTLRVRYRQSAFANCQKNKSSYRISHFKKSPQLLCEHLFTVNLI